MIAAYSETAVGWSPIPGRERAGGKSGPGLTRSISPVRAQSAVESKPVRPASGPVSP